MSRWLVGSSSSSASGRMRRMRASATRIFHPPESAPTSPSIMSWSRAEPGEDLARAGVEPVAAELLEAGLHLAEALTSASSSSMRVGVGQRVLELGQLGGDVGDRAGAGHGLGDDAAPRHLADVLAEVADA